MINEPITITKISGEKNVFDESKLKHSLERSGASDLVIKEIIDEIETSL